MRFAPVAAEVLKDAVQDVEHDAAAREAGHEQRRDEAALAREQARDVELRWMTMRNRDLTLPS